MTDGYACPSGRCRVGAQLLGVHLGDHLAFVDPVLPITAEFIERVQASGGDAEGRFRFTEACIERGCGQWGEDGCGVIEKLLDVADDSSSTDLPACGIRDRCRWFAQRGGSACAVCPYVVTDNRATLAPIELTVDSTEIR